MNSKDWTERFNSQASQQVLERYYRDGTLLAIHGQLGFALIGETLYVRLLAPGKQNLRVK